jgi:enoyl-CoA hydratase/carnithine racemase
MAKALIFEKRDQIGFVTLNRPDQRNALNMEMYGLLTETWDRINEDDDIRAAVVTGAGDKVFCAGMDLKEVARLKSEGKDDFLKHVGDPFLLKMRAVKKPIIAAINGNVFAGGFMLSLHADIRVAVEGTTFAITESRMGRGSPWAIPLLWMLPLGINMELTLTGDPLPADRMYHMGFINRLVKKEELMPTAVTIAERIRDNAPLSVMAAKESLLRGMDLGLGAGLEKAIEIYKTVYESEDAQEGPRAFAEKRKPVWKGR